VVAAAEGGEQGLACDQGEVLGVGLQGVGLQEGVGEGDLGGGVLPGGAATTRPRTAPWA